MENKLFKKVGRTEINKLDWILAISACLISICSLWISLGISIANAGGATPESFLIFLRGLSFQWGVTHSQADGIAVCVSLFTYNSLLILIFGVIYFLRAGMKERIPGAVAQFILFLGGSFLMCFAFEFLGGKAAGTINSFWPISLIVLLGICAICAILTIYVTFNKEFNIELVDEDEEDEIPGDEVFDDEYEPNENNEVEDEVLEEDNNQEQAAEEAPVEEEKQPEEAQPEVKEEAPVEEPVQEEEPVVAAAAVLLNNEEAPSENSENEEEEGDKFSQLGPRRKRIPFENKVKSAKPETKARYKMIVTALRRFDFNDRKSVPCETFSYKKRKMIILTFAGKTLKVFFRLDPKQFVDSTIPIVDASDIVKYQDTPSMLIVKSDLAARRVISLAEKVAEEQKIPQK